MINSSKSEYQCQVCSKILKDPIHLPCHCTICHAHLTDGTAKDGRITCVECKDTFVVKDMDSKVNRWAKRILESEGHLSPEEKAAKSELQKLLNEFQQLYNKLQQEHAIFEVGSHDHFAEIKRQIDLQREELKEKIDEIYFDMISKVEQHEAFYKQKMNETRCFQEFNAEKETETFEEEFRKVDLTIQRVQQLKSKYEANVKAAQDNMDKLQFMGKQMKKSTFMAKKDFDISSFGALDLMNLNRYLASSSFDKTIKLWDLETSECIRTLEGHTDKIQCMDVLENGHLISGSYDKSLKVWNPNDGVCLKTIAVSNSVIRLKVLSGNRVACGSYEKIYIWDLNTDTCIQTLVGHTDSVQCIISLSDDHLASCSQDNTIKTWNLNDSTCVKTFHGHTDQFYSLLLLKNGHLASGSADKSIKIWEKASSECFKTLQGHTEGICALESTDTFDLISCSGDKSIRIWNTANGDCIRTLLGHTDEVFRIRVYSSGLLVSGSCDNSIKLWDLSSGQCTHTLDGHQNAVNSLCFI